MLIKKGKPGRALGTALEAGTIIFSPETLIEAIEVLHRPKFDRYLSEDERFEFLADLLETAEILPARQIIHESRDPDDNKFLELAVEVNAECIVSGDKDLLVLESIQGIPIMNADAFLKQYSA